MKTFTPDSGDNAGGFADSAGELEPWIELYNNGASVLALDGFYLSRDYTQLTQWAFPSGTVINGGEFKVIFADGQPDQSTANELHTSFRLTSGSGSVALSRIASGRPQLVDYLNYKAVSAGHSYGAFPDGQPFFRQELLHATPGETNNGVAPPPAVYINEWMASNSRTIPNPDNNNKYDDWFELYNPGSQPANLGGNFLTHRLSNKVQFQIPNGYAISPRGYLLVWADGLPNLNNPTRPDLHVNFNLGKSGDAIGLFSADGAQIDAVAFGLQTADVSQGRCPDGSASLALLTVPTPRAANSCSPLVLVSLNRSAHSVALSWQAIIGNTYQVQYKDTLQQANWSSLGASLRATNASLTISDNLSGNAQRFYRILAE